MRKSLTLLPAGVLAAVIIGSACTPPPPPPPPPPPTTTPAAVGVSSCPAAAVGTTPSGGASPISSWGVDVNATNHINSSVVIGNVVYVGGVFGNVVAPNGTFAARHNVAAFCLATGEFLNTFTANTDGPVNALTTDGASLFIGGDFTTLNGVASNRLVKVSASTGARDGSFNPLAIPAPVNKLAFSAGVVYAAGEFGQIGAAPATQVGNAAGFNAGGTVVWSAGADQVVQSIAVSNGFVYIGGNFTTVQGQPHDRLAKISKAGAVQPVSYGISGAGVVLARTLDIAVDPGNENQIFAAVGPAVAQSGNGKRVVYFDATGAAIWDNNKVMDVAESVEVLGGRLFFGFAKGYDTSKLYRVLGADYTKSPTSGTYVTFNPAANGTLGVVDLSQGNGHLVAVGDFNVMGGTSNLGGLAIFA